ncbi:Serine/threonine-protein kinase PknB [Stieleria neptunia]|uniref:Serine/threonine-protein kinase PknB n=1 Tax=Stieleria neptunia TaxID=2527979 RepID=A0A518HUM8_9BACT|nr:protein kinase [Stieleria neptunia]QDV44562.1 Serine/threonine-protein kinase PknB [Stieleria neptunia]
MNNAAPITCSTCGRTLRPDAPEQLCPACLMTGAMEVDDLPATEIRPVEVEAEGLLVAVDDGEGDPAAAAPHEFGGYCLIKVLGKGGMGVVYEAEQIATGRRVALKMLGTQLDSPEVRARFLREGRLAAGVSHPNSVYVFGTEEIEGLPVITMEIVGGGTLQDKLDRVGQLPIVEAVDAMLDVIEGLEAALSKDVLHRDIKPSNCFIGPDGRVKVGDFGLSVSTISSVETFATATGVALGTPAFASPEQLRGNELDHRSDIYSIGSTLYTLLSGSQPFGGNNAVHIVAAVLDEVPKPLDQLRDDVPPELSAVVAKCLAKKPESRFGDYTSLRKVLLPFSSRRPEPEPAPLSRRALAGMIDLSIAWTLPRTLLAASVGALEFSELIASPWYWPFVVASCVWFVAYFGATEGFINQSLGKRLLGLRVTTKSGRQIGIKRAVARSLLSLLAVQTLLVMQALFVFDLVGFGLPGWLYGVIYLSIGLTLLLLPMVTMRRRNAMATVWDKLTQTRVVMPAVDAVRLKVWDRLPACLEQELSDRMEAYPTEIGPYRLTRIVRDPDWIEAIDPALQRIVWLKRRTEPLEPCRREVARPGRLRWLQSVCKQDEVWDAFETKPGVPAAQIVSNSNVTWEASGHWLYDLSLELASASDDRTLPQELSLDHVWITQQGHAVLLDDAYPQGSETTNNVVDLVEDPTEQGALTSSTTKLTQNFLSNVAATTRPHTIPLRARALLVNLRLGKFDRLSFLAGNLRSLLTKPARIDRGSRATALLTVPLLLIATAWITGQANEQSYRAASARWSAAYPGLPPLSTVLLFRHPLQERIGEQTLRIHLAGHYSEFLDDLQFRDDRTDIVATLGDPAMQDFLRRTLKRPPKFSVAELKRADRRVADGLQIIFATWKRSRTLEMLGLALFVLAFTGTVQLAAIMLSGRTVGQAVFGYAVVDDAGAPVGRLRMIARWLVTWIPIAIVLWLTQINPWAYLALVPWLAAAIFAIRSPERGLPEQLTGTWLVPR